MALKLHEFLEQLIIDTFLNENDQSEKTGSTDKFFIRLKSVNLVP